MLLDSSDTDTSMEINAMAMKYLKDEQLTQLTKLQAKNRLLLGTRKASSEKATLLQKILRAEEAESTPNVTTMGMSPNDLTFATKRYLEKHGLLDGGGGGEPGLPSDSSREESYQLRTNYSTMTSGSDDGPAQVTHEVISTPSSRPGNYTDNSARSGRRYMTESYGQNGANRTPYNDSFGNRTPHNDSQPSVQYNGTPKPNHVQARFVDHQRMSSNRSPPQNASNNREGMNYTPYSENPSPYMQNNRQMNGGGAARYASPQITPAPNMNRLSPTDRDTRQHQRSPHESRPETQNNPHFNGYADRDNDNNNHHASRQVKDAFDDDRILDITRLKQLPKLL